MLASTVLSASSNVRVLSVDYMRMITPAVYAMTPSPRTTKRYRFINTNEVLSGLMEAGFYPVDARQARTRAHNRDYARHMLRLRHSEHSYHRGDVIPELVIVNSHGGASSFSLLAGLWRMHCDNGLITPVGDFGHIVVPHRASIVTDVVEAARTLAQYFTPVVEQVKLMELRILTDDEKSSFAMRALQLRYGVDPAPFPLTKLLEAKRETDIGNDLWKVLNVCQEQILRGGIEYKLPSGRASSTRRLTSITEEVRLNNGLWLLARDYLPPFETANAS